MYRRFKRYLGLVIIIPIIDWLLKKLGQEDMI